MLIFLAADDTSRDHDEQRLTLRRDPGIELELHSSSLAIVTLRGEHDLASSPEIANQLSRASDHANVLVDLSACTFMDSAVISALLRASNALNTRGGLLSLVIPHGRHLAIRSVFELMSIERLMPTYGTRAEAIAHLADVQPATTQPRTRLRALGEIIDASLLETDERRHAA